MYDELVKRLRELASIPAHCENVESCDECPKEAICLSFTNARIVETAMKAADAIEELSKPRWISTEELLPKDLQNVLVIDDERVTIGHCEHLYADEQIYVEWHDTLYYPIDPPYWMPLPEPPKEE